MTDWQWVGLAFTIVYGSLIAYAIGLGRRIRNARKALEQR